MTTQSIRTSFWKKLTGDAEEFSMENRAFNYICIISFLLVLSALLSDLYLGEIFMSGVISVLLGSILIMYYFSRYKKSYKVSTAVFLACCYIALTLNFFANDGINGPTLPLFCITMVFIITLVKPAYHAGWLAGNLFIILTLLAVEYNYPHTVIASYPDRASRFLDMGATSVVCLTFIYLLINYLRKYYDAKRILADKSALAISAQNIQIISQNKQLEIVNEEKNKLFSIVAHDLKSPLDAIRGYLELLSEQQLDENDKELIQDELLEQTRYTTDLLLNLTSWAKTQMDGVVVNLLPVKLGSSVKEFADHNASLAVRKGLKLSYCIDPAITVVADKNMLHIVIRNLINNAIKFTPRGGEVTVSVEIEAMHAILSVHDTGIGISPEKQSEIFTLKTSSTYGTEREKGIGLGLLMCKEFVDYLQGEIWFESIPGMGTTFYIRLPISKK